MECYDMLVRTGAFDIEIEGYKYIWNLTDKGWATRRIERPARLFTHGQITGSH